MVKSRGADEAQHSRGSVPQSCFCSIPQLLQQGAPYHMECELERILFLSGLIYDYKQSLGRGRLIFSQLN